MASTKERLKLLEKYISGLRPQTTTFIVEGDREFHTPLSPEQYLVQFGAYTPDGQRIVRYPHPANGIDDLSLSLYELIDKAVEKGRLEFPELESDPIA